MQGTQIDEKYEIIRQLGEGGMGAVYEARHLGTARRVAVKVISSSLAKGPEVVARFQREARASGSIDSQHVVQVLDTGIDPATSNPYMVMEYMAGEDLHQLIERLGVLSPDLALRMVAQACQGLGRAHEIGILHRDIKSANLFLAHREGSERVVKILDFGIAKIRADQYSQTGNHGITLRAADASRAAQLVVRERLRAVSRQLRSCFDDAGRRRAKSSLRSLIIARIAFPRSAAQV